MGSRWQTSAKGETPYALGDLTSGQAATIVVYKVSDSSTPALTSNVCNEMGSTGIFKWATAQITTQPTVFTQYAFIMTDALGIKSKGRFDLGGYVDTVADVNTKTTNLPSDPASQSAVETFIEDNGDIIITNTTNQTTTMQTIMNTTDKRVKDLLGMIMKKANKSDVSALLDAIEKASKKK